MHLCIRKLANIGSVSGLLPGRHQTIIWTNAGILLLLMGPLGANFSENLIELNSYIFIQENAFGNVVWKMATILSQPECVKFSDPYKI